MISNNLEDYEVLSILGADLNSTCYKVRSKSTLQILVWKAISYEDFTELEKETFLAQINKQKTLDHPHLVQIYDYIVHEDTKVVYLISEFCAKGNLTGIIHKCLLENEYLTEDFLWRIMYQIACALRITATSSLHLSNVFVDANYKVKLFNNDLLKSAPSKHKRLDVCFGIIMLELCSLQVEKTKNRNSVMLTKQILSGIPNHYSNEFKEVIRFMFANSFEPKGMVDAILCHPTILLKSTQVLREIFVKKNVLQQENASIDNMTNAKLETVHHLCSKNLKSRETALKVREERLVAKEHELHRRERKVALLERTVKDKMLQAELYLKRCRESRSTSSGSSKSGPTKSKVVNYEHIDTSLSADCSIIVPTSRRMNSEVIKKPVHFTRSLSERRVQFKGHSPLKDMFTRNGSRDRILQQPEASSVLETTSVHLNRSETLPHKRSKSRKKLDLSLLLPARHRKPLVDKNVIYEETEGNAHKQTECRPISWTEESKQHAFELLRIMNQNHESEPVKHTYL